MILSKSLLEQGWPMMHGFFIIMGGFHPFEHGFMGAGYYNKAILHDHNVPLHPLATCNLFEDDVHQSIRVDINSTSFTVPTEEEIKDKGKSDWLTKSLVLLQTSWFITQYIAQAIEHLPVTHLKTMMLAYVAMNFVIYIFWWNKPLNINCPV